ncbi:MAG: tetratricopeptide repeat protein [Candidatus Brocadiae bacterium]|nr:tetratricopeptide repeat protein [Candidatus Brocadiia bacterium]
MSHYEDGVAGYKKHDDSAAIAAFRKALEEDPGHYRAATYLALTLERSGDLEAAEGAARLASSINDQYPKSFNALGNIQRALGKLDDAMAAYRSASKLDPASALYRHNLGITCVDVGMLEEAVTELGEAARLDARNADVWWDLSQASVKRNDLSTAKDALEKYLEIRPRGAHAQQAWCDLGDCLVAQGDAVGARLAYNTYLEGPPDDREGEVRAKLERLEREDPNVGPTFG